MKIERWQIDPAVAGELEDHYKTAYAMTLRHEEPMVIAKALTFDHLADSVTEQELAEVIRRLNTSFLDGGIRGTGIEVGAGPGTFVAALANMDSIEKVYGLDACEAIVVEVMEPVVKHLAPQNSEKVIGVVGEFNNLELPDNSVDFVFDFFSLHHSPVLPETMIEIARVLKPGGVLICFDKARHNALTSADLERLLDKEYPAQSKQQMGIPVEKYHTRRMNGEFEYRLKDWLSAFQAAGLNECEYYNVAKVAGIWPVRMVKLIMSFLPIKMQTLISPLFSRSVTNNLSPERRIFTNLFPSYPREFSLMLAYKK